MNSTTSHERSDVRLANESWESLMTAHATLTSQFAAEGMWEKLAMNEYDVLYALAKGGRPLRICEIQEGVLLSQPALSRLIERLAARGLVMREADPDDGRAWRISLTEAGKQLRQRVGRAHAKSVTQALSRALSHEEMATLQRLCTRLAEYGRPGEETNHA